MAKNNCGDSKKDIDKWHSISIEERKALCVVCNNKFKCEPYQMFLVWREGI